MILAPFENARCMGLLEVDFIVFMLFLWFAQSQFFWYSLRELHFCAASQQNILPITLRGLYVTIMRRVENNWKKICVLFMFIINITQLFLRINRWFLMVNLYLHLYKSIYRTQKQIKWVNKTLGLKNIIAVT